MPMRPINRHGTPAQEQVRSGNIEKRDCAWIAVLFFGGFAPHGAKGCGIAHTTQRNSQFQCRDRKIASMELKTAHDGPDAGVHVQAVASWAREMGQQIVPRSLTTHKLG